MRLMGIIVHEIDHFRLGRSACPAPQGLESLEGIQRSGEYRPYTAFLATSNEAP